MHRVLLAVQAMGTRFELVMLGHDEGRLRAVGEEALREIELWHDRLSRFQASSDTSRLNRDRSSKVDAELGELLELCERTREESGGAFDVRVGLGGWLDFGAVGKGFALDRAAMLLREHRGEVQAALLHGGTSSVVAIGAPPEAAGWPVCIRSDGEMLRIELSDQALGVSAPRGRVGVHGTTHIVDPRSGLPAIHTDTAAVVASLDAPDACALCDAWSTALVVLGDLPRHFPPGFEAHFHRPGGEWIHHQSSCAAHAAAYADTPTP